MKSYFIKIKQLLREQIANIEIVVKRSHHLVVAESHMDFTVGHIDDSLLAIDHTDHVDVGHGDFWIVVGHTGIAVFLYLLLALSIKSIADTKPHPIRLP